MQTLTDKIDDAVVIRDALAMYRSPIRENVTRRDRLLRRLQDAIDRAAMFEDVEEGQTRDVTQAGLFAMLRQMEARA